MTEHGTSSQEVLHFWFEETSPQQWFVKSDAFDATISHRFGQTLLSVGEALEAGGAPPWGSDVRAILATVILLDQFPRNIYRGTPDAFRFDPLALALAHGVIETNDDMKLRPVERSFLYMPLMHSETLTDQSKCVELMETRVGEDANIHHAKEHRKVIERFGRFPHRNAILGRLSTSEETSYLEEGGYTP